MAAALAVLATVATASVGSEVRAQPYFEADAIYRVSTGDAPSRGPADAPVTIVEFSDFQCRFCVRSQAILADLMALYPGQIRLVYRHNPLDPEDGTLAAEASLAAAEQGRFWAMHHRLFADPAQLTRAAIDGYARELGLDMVRFRRALDERRLRAAVLADADVARRLGIRSTPMFFINGRPVKGSQPLSVFAGVVDQELARAARVRAEGVEPARLYRTLVARGKVSADDRPGADPSYAVARIDPNAVYRLRPALPGHSRGRPDAPIRVVVLADFECGFCAREAPRLRILEERFPGLLRFEFRHLPLRMHAGAQLAAEAAVEAAVQGKFWAFHDRVFAAGEPLPRPALERHAAAAGLDMAAFRAALDDRRHRELVVRRSAALRALGVSGTPTIFVNGRPLVGAVELDVLTAVVLRAQQELADGAAEPDVVERVAVAP